MYLPSTFLIYSQISFFTIVCFFFSKSFSQIILMCYSLPIFGNQNFFLDLMIQLFPIKILKMLIIESGKLYIGQMTSPVEEDAMAWGAIGTW